ncbi:hypothetical protein SAMN05446589_1408 [Streptomyces sp. OV198]|nr:hypothetical protein SAMN05446589_1408 [Streptomyces sp. OV198]
MTALPQRRGRPHQGPAVRRDQKTQHPGPFLDDQAAAGECARPLTAVTDFPLAASSSQQWPSGRKAASGSRAAPEAAFAAPRPEYGAGNPPAGRHRVGYHPPCASKLHGVTVEVQARGSRGADPRARAVLGCRVLRRRSGQRWSTSTPPLRVACVRAAWTPVQRRRDAGRGHRGRATHHGSDPMLTDSHRTGFVRHQPLALTLVFDQSSGPACLLRRVRGFTRLAHFAPQARFVGSAAAAQRYGAGVRYTELRVQLQRALARNVPAFMGRLGVAGDEDGVNGQPPGSTETRIMEGDPVRPPVPDGG